MRTPAKPSRLLLVAGLAALCACRPAAETTPESRLTLAMVLDAVERCDELASRASRAWQRLQSQGEGPYDRFPDGVADEMADDLSRAALELVVLEGLVDGTDQLAVRELFDSARALCRLALEPGDNLGSFDQLQGGVRNALGRAREKHRRALRIPAAELAELAERRDRLLETVRLREEAALAERRREERISASDELAVRQEEWRRHWRYQEEIRRRRAARRRQILERRGE